jgi:TIR domain
MAGSVFMYAFLSYQTADKRAAGKVRGLLEKLCIGAFLAHEDIQVSHEWRATILKEIRKVDLFIPILTADYYKSPWCVQESGIAAFRGLCIIPLSLDGSIPQGFIAHIQSTKVDPDNIQMASLFPGLAKKDVGFVIDALIDIIKESGSFRGAEANFESITPYLDKATDEQLLKLLKVLAANGQVLHASLCAKKYLPPLLTTHGHRLDQETRARMEKVLAEYA